MITVVKNNEQYVISYIEWKQVGQSGFDKFHGEYVWINDLWIHENHSYDWSIFRELIRGVFDKAVGAKEIYFKRMKYAGRLKSYSREKIMKLIDRVPALVFEGVL